MKPIDALRATSQSVATTRQLLCQGITADQLTEAVRSRELVRVRRGHYAAPGIDDLTARAVRVGGRLSCVSAADRLGVWVPDDPFPHVALRHEASRLRSPGNGFVALSDENRDGATLHWWPLVDERHASQHIVSAIDAVRHVIRCQPWPMAIAVLDSALYEKVLRPSQLNAVFFGLPQRLQKLRKRINSKCESGIESIVRLLLEELGLPFELQKSFRGVGDVDFVVAGCLVIETDGKLGHEGEEGQLRDYGRDLALIARGYSVLRLNYRQVMFQRADVVVAIYAALASHRRYIG